MTEQELDKFRQTIYEPYKEAWEIIKWMRDTEPKDDKLWAKYYEKATELPRKYGNTEIALNISRVVLDAGTEYQRIKGKK